MKATLLALLLSAAPALFAGYAVVLVAFAYRQASRTR